MYMETDSDEVALRYYVSVLWRRKLAVLLTVGVIIAAGSAYTYSQTPTYQSTAMLLLQPSVAENIFNPDPGAARRGQSDGNQVQTEIEVMRSQPVREAVAEALGQRPLVAIAQQGDTDFVGITATSTEPEEAARIAQTYAETYLTVRREQMAANLLGAIEQVQAQIDPIRQQLAELNSPIVELNAQIADTASEDSRHRLQEQRDGLIRQTEGQRALLQRREESYAAHLDRLTLASSVSNTGGAQLVDSADIPTSPSSPKPMRNLIVALGLGALLGVVVAFLREHYDTVERDDTIKENDTIKGREDLEQVNPDLPVLGLIPTVPGWQDPETAMLISVGAPSSPPAEAYRALRTSLQFVGLERPLGLVQVTSPNQGESKTTTVCNLAVSLARSGNQVILVDCDLRKPRLHEFFGFDNAVGLTSVLIGDVSLADAVQPVSDEPKLTVLASGPIPPAPSKVLSSQHCDEILKVLAAEADFVLLDSPPVLPFTDAIALAGVVDAVLMVVAANVTTQDSAERAIELLEQVNAPLIGNVLVLNGIR